MTIPNPATTEWVPIWNQSVEAGLPTSATDQAVVIFSGTTGKTLADSHVLISNVAQRDQDNTFTSPFQMIRAATPRLTLFDTAAAADQKAWRFVPSGGSLVIRTINDALNVVLRDALTLTQTGNAIVAGQVIAKGTGDTTYGGLHNEGSYGEVRLRELAQPANGQMWRLLAYQGQLQFWAGYDNTQSQNIPLKLTRAGNVEMPGSLTVSGNITAGGYLMSSGVIYPGRVDTGTQQGSWYLGSHAAYGLYSNTGLYVQGALQTAGGLVVAGGGASITGTLTVNAVNVNAGSLTVAGNITCTGIVQPTGYVYPGRIDAPGNANGSFCLASHFSYGLYINTGLYLESGVYPDNVNARATINAGAGITGAHFYGGVYHSTSGPEATGLYLATAYGGHSNPNVLDAYQEGAWSPTLQAQSGQVFGISVSSNVYVKVGRLIYASAYIAITSVPAGTGCLVLSGLPWPTSHDCAPSIFMNNMKSGLGGTNIAWAYTPTGSGSINIFLWGSDPAVQALMPWVKVGTDFRITATYMAYA